MVGVYLQAERFGSGAAALSVSAQRAAMGPRGGGTLL